MGIVPLVVLSVVMALVGSLCYFSRTERLKTEMGLSVGEGRGWSAQISVLARGRRVLRKKRLAWLLGSHDRGEAASRRASSAILLSSSQLCVQGLVELDRDQL